MITLIVSDIHCGDNKSGYEDCLSFIDKQPEVDQLIIAGDLFDLWVTSAGRAFKQGRKFLDYIIHRFGYDIIYLTGNHDEDIKYLLSINGIKVQQFYKFTRVGKRFYMCHGHQYDRSFYLNKLTALAKFNAYMVNITDKLFSIDTRRWLISLSEKTRNDPYEKHLARFESDIKNKIGYTYDFVITGHTHDPKIDVSSNLAYINSGDWMQHRTGIKITEDTIQLLSLDNNEIVLLDELIITSNKL